MAGYIKLHRQLLDSYQFCDPNYLKVWIWILLKANHKPKKILLKISRGSTDVNIDRGQFVFGRHKAAEELKMSDAMIYRIVKKFELDGSIALKSNNHYSILTVCKYDDYNCKDDFDEQQTNSQRTANEQPTNTNKNDKKEKNDKNSKSITFTPPVLEEVELYFADNKYDLNIAKKAFNYYSVAGWKDARGNQVKNWKQKMQSVWFKEENIDRSSMPTIEYIDNRDEQILPPSLRNRI